MMNIFIHENTDKGFRYLKYSAAVGYKTFQMQHFPYENEYFINTLAKYFLWRIFFSEIMNMIEIEHYRKQNVQWWSFPHQKDVYDYSEQKTLEWWETRYLSEDLNMLSILYTLVTCFQGTWITTGNYIKHVIKKTAERSSFVIFLNESCWFVWKLHLMM